MTDIAKTDELFFTRAGLDRSRVEGIVTEALGNADDVAWPSAALSSMFAWA